MKNLVIFIFSILVVFLQLSATGVFFSFTRIPDLTLAYVLALVLAFGFKDTYKWILIVGILIDAGSRVLLGTTALALFVVALVVSWIADVAELRSRKTFFLAVIAFLVAFSEIVKDLVLVVVSKIQERYLAVQTGVVINFFSIDYILKIVYTILAAYVIYYILRRMSRSLFWEPKKLAKSKFS
jgi:rod shape-determining protein MreD